MSAKTEVFIASGPPRCQINISQQNCWTTSLTISTLRETLSRVVVSSPNRGYPELAITFSPKSNSLPQKASNHGDPHFRIPPPPPLVTPGYWTSGVSKRLLPRMQKKELGFQLSPALWISWWTSPEDIQTSRQYLSAHSTDSPPTLNPST